MIELITKGHQCRKSDDCKAQESEMSGLTLKECSRWTKSGAFFQTQPTHSRVTKGNGDKLRLIALFYRSEKGPQFGIKQ
jgi:hypothetical protein